MYEQISAANQPPDADDDGASSQAKRRREDASEDDASAAPKKPKKGKTQQEKSDAVLARQLSNELNGRARSSRAGSSTKKTNGAKRGARKGNKSSATVNSDGEEDAEGDRPPKKSKSRKNPNVDTSFLPDREREEQERRDREELRQEWLKKQEEMKNEDIEITYSYWDGSGHRKSVMVGCVSTYHGALHLTTQVIACISMGVV